MQNPITQLKQHRTAQNRVNHSVKAESKVMTPPEPKQAENAIKGEKTKLTFQPFAQVGYIFQQAKWNTANCKLNHPDCFHFKKQMQQGAKRISNQLRNGERLLDELAKSLSLTGEQLQILKAYQNASRFLSKQFYLLADYVEQVEQAQGDELNALCYRKG